MSKEKTLKDFVKQAKNQIQEIEVTEVHDYLKQGYQILDVREPGEYLAGTIAGALNIPRGVLEPAADHEYAGHHAELMDRDKKWLLFCVSSGRSAMATVTLQQMGFKNVKNINGGMNAWKMAELPIVQP